MTDFNFFIFPLSKRKIGSYFKIINEAIEQPKIPTA
jgi:hypothetical protein